tara:strand:+ start:3851 stop:4045 length:195 start_codon:yes stop_codon:yes gene_type:complete
MDLGTFATACNAQKVCDMLNQRIELLAVVESLAQHDTRNAPQSLHKLALRAREAIAKTKPEGGE